MATHRIEATSAPTTLWPDWYGGCNLGCTVCMSDVGCISLQAVETYSQAGHYRININHTTSLPWP